MSGSITHFLASLAAFSLLQQALLLLLSSLWAVLQQQLEQSCCCALVQSLSESGERRGNLQTLAKDTPLPLNAHISGPLDQPVQILLWGRSSTNACSSGKLSAM